MQPNFRLKKFDTQKSKKAATLVLEQDRLESTPQEQLAVGGALLLGCIALFRAFADMGALYSPQLIPAVAGAAVLFPALQAAIAIFAFAAADLASGIYHFLLDNYGSRETPIFGEQIAAFQGHHQYPWTITHRDWCNNVYKSCAMSLLPLTFVTMYGGLDASPNWMTVSFRVFGSVFLLSVAFAQEFHKWSHMIRPPPVVRFLQRSGFLISQREHGQHHQSPYHEKYCIVSGWCNHWLDETNFFRHLELWIWRLTGAEPQTWRLGVPNLIASNSKGEVVGASQQQRITSD
jgi:ubiquitin-conjugating enzyme E2 variant